MSQAQEGSVPVIDLTHQMDVAYWCRIFDVRIEELRDAIHHAGHQVPEVRRYLSERAAPTAR